MSCSCLTSTSAFTIFTVYCRGTLSALLLKGRNQQFQISGKTWALLHKTPPWDQPQKQKFRSSAWALSWQLPWRTVRWSTSWRFFSVQHHVHLKNERQEREKERKKGFYGTWQYSRCSCVNEHCWDPPTLSLPQTKNRSTDTQQFWLN